MPASAIELATTLARRLGIDHAGFDIAMVDDAPVVLEFNRLFGNQGIDSPETSVGEAILEHLEQDSWRQAA